MDLLALKSIRQFAMYQHDRIWGLRGEHVRAMADPGPKPYLHLNTPDARWGDMGQEWWRLVGEITEARRMCKMAPHLYGAGWPDDKPPPEGSTPFRNEVTADGMAAIITGFITPDGTLVVTDIDTVGADKENDG